MPCNLPTPGRPTLRHMHELTSAARLSAWGSAALEGAVSLDDAADVIAGSDRAAHRVFGLDGEDGGVNVAYALGRLRADGAHGLRLVLPRPGDIGGSARAGAVQRAGTVAG